jgi:hypothetical protein
MCGTPSPTNHSRLSRADGSMSSPAANRRSRVRCMYLHQCDGVDASPRLHCRGRSALQMDGTDRARTIRHRARAPEPRSRSHRTACGAAIG